MFSTGEFSRIARVSKRLLQYYDEIGLLHPTHTDSQTGYRYYSAKQLPQLNRILAMKDLGLSLDQIRRLMRDKVSNEEIRGMLLLQKADLERKLLADFQRFRSIESRLQSLDGSSLPDGVMKAIPRTEIIATVHLCLTANDGLPFVQEMMRYLPTQVDMRQLGSLIAIATVEEFITENIPVEFGFVVTGYVPETLVLNHDLVLKKRTLPTVAQIATIAYIGHPQHSYVGYSELANWIEVNGYRMAGHQREIFIELTSNPDKTVMELQIPVERADALTLFDSLSLKI